MRRLLLSSLLALFLAAGCGGDDESAGEQWAADFCSAAAEWRTSLDDVVGQFQSPSDLSADSLRGAIDEGLGATETFVDDVRALGAPETEAGQEAAGIVDSMTSTVQATVDDLRDTFDSGGDSLPELLGKLSEATGQIQAMGQDLRGSLDQLEEVEGGELRDALESNDDCSTARAGS